MPKRVSNTNEKKLLYIVSRRQGRNYAPSFKAKIGQLSMEKTGLSMERVPLFRESESYEKLVDRFFRESVNVFEPERRRSLRIECLDDSNYFLKLLESTMEYYDDMN